MTDRVVGLAIALVAMAMVVFAAQVPSIAAASWGGQAPEASYLVALGLVLASAFVAVVGLGIAARAAK